MVLIFRIYREFLFVNKKEFYKGDIKNDNDK